MSGNFSAHLDMDLAKIKSALLSLKAAGAYGFEGLLRLSLTKLTGVPFRLAASGLQGGMDGDSAMPSNSVSFEAKLYSGHINRETVLTKIVDLAGRESASDRLWVLGATTEISAQLAKAVGQAGDSHDISTLILDWIPSPLPLLAVAVIATGDEAIDFLVTHSDKKLLQQKVSRYELTAAFMSISTHPEFENLLQSLKLNLNVSKLAFERAINLNIQWRQETFSSISRARERLGQALAVKENSNVPMMRSGLKTNLTRELQISGSVVLSGDEGHGKSWLAAQICAESDGMALFISAEQFDGITVDRIEDFMIDLLIRQTGDLANEVLRHRWRHRFKAWKTSPLSAVLLVVVDGINQRQNIRWDRMLSVLQSRLKEIGGYLVVTVRPQFWKKTVIRGLNFSPTIIEIPEWLPEERDELLQHYGVSLNWLDENTLNTLKNPRLLSVAVTTLPLHQPIVWKGLTTDRLLMEHLRVSQRENFENETFETLTSRLSEHATQVLARVQTSSNEVPPSFQTESTAVIETRFFRPIPGPGDLYELRDEGLTLALGFTLVDQLWQIQRAKCDLAERIVELIEPIRAMDRTSDVIFAALLVCALDEDIRFDKSIFAALLDMFSSLQNVNDQRFEEFVEIVRQQPVVFFNVLKTLCLERWRRVNHDWFIHASFEIAITPLGWQTAEATIHEWLHCYNMDAKEQFNRFHRKDDPENEKRLQGMKDDLNAVLASLSSYEQGLLDQMTEVSGDTNSLFTLALQLLSGHPLASFADSFITMGLAFALDTGVHSARKAFQQLTMFNRIDRLASKEAFIHAIIPLQDPNTSQSGQWTVVRMLYATGDEKAAAEAEILAKELRKMSIDLSFHYKTHGGKPM